MPQLAVEERALIVEKAGVDTPDTLPMWLADAATKFMGSKAYSRSVEERMCEALGGVVAALLGIDAAADKVLPRGERAVAV